MGTILRLAWRNTWRNPRRTGLVIAAVGTGIAGCLLTMAVNFGMMLQMVETAIETDVGHLQVHATGWDEQPGLDLHLPARGERVVAALTQRPEVRAAARRIRGEGLLQSPRASVGVRVMAVEPAAEPRVSRVPEQLVRGRWLGGDSRLVIGEGLAASLEVDVGSKVVLSAQDANGDLTGQVFRVGGLLATASRELNRRAVYLPLGAAQELFGLGDAISEVVAVVRDDDELDRVVAAVEQEVGQGREVRDWRQLRPLLVYMVRSFESSAWVVYLAVFVAMAFGIANVLLMSVYERTREIGTLLAMGMPRRRIVATIAGESLVVTLLGLAVGVAAAALAVALLGDGIDLRAFAEGLTDLGVGTRIVPVLRPGDLWIPLNVAVVTALLSSLWPALRASRLRPAESLRHV